MRTLVFATKAMVLLGMLLSCTSREEIAGTGNQGPLSIVLIASLSGPLSDFGWSMVRGGRMRMEDDTEGSTHNGRAVRLIVLDDRGKAEMACALAKNLDNNRMAGVIGHLTTGSTLSAIPAYTPARFILISPIATGDGLERIQAPYIFRTILSESQQAISLAIHIHRKIDGKRAAVVCEDSALGGLLRDVFVSRSRQLGLSVDCMLVEGAPFPDVTEVIEEILSARYGAIFVAGGPRLAALLTRKLSGRVDRPLLYGTYRLISNEFMEVAGEHGRGVLAAHPCIRRSDFKRGSDVRKRYEKRYKYTMDWLASQTYDAVGLLLWSIHKTGVDPDSMRGVLHSLNSAERSFPGLAGPIYFNPTGSLAREVAVAVYTASGWKLMDQGR